MVAINTLVSLLTVAVAPLALAHPNEDNAEAIKHEMKMRNAQHAKATRALSQCQNSAGALALKKSAANRRAAKLAELRSKRGLTGRSPPGHQTKRDMESLLAWAEVDHNRTASDGYTLDTPETTIFGSNNTCALVPETTIGPYYVEGELIRKDIGEGQAGVPLYYMNTCTPVPELVADVWSCNATGYYSGIANQAGLNTTFLRGIQISDDDGVVAFDAIFPGHYDRRVTHIHVVAQNNYTVQSNATIADATNVLHIGQLYFDDALVKAVEANAPYTENTVAYTSYEDDGWMLDEATTDYDPFVEYAQLSENVEDGVLAWITIAVDVNSNHTSNKTVAAHYYEDGGVTLGIYDGSDRDGPAPSGVPPSS